MVNWIRSLDRVLKGEATRPAALRGGSIELPLFGLTVVLLLLGVLYGASMGTFALVARWDTSTRDVGYLQIAASAAKVPLLFFLTLVVTFPSLYVFNALVGSRLSLTAVLRLIVASMAVTLAVLASFATIVLFFSLCTSSYPFMVLLNVALFALAGLMGMGFLLQTLNRLSAAHAAEAVAEERAASAEAVGTPAPVDLSVPGGYPPPLPPSAARATGPYEPTRPPMQPGALDRLKGEAIARHVKRVFGIWVLVFGLVGAQMSCVLRPFIGKPDAPFTFFRERDGNFFQAVSDKFDELVNAPTKPNRRGGRNAPAAVPARVPASQPNDPGDDAR